MSSINPNNIDGTYPIAGQDNDSQGFRNNFTNIRNNLAFAELEIEALEQNAILKSPLAGITLNNNMNNTPLVGAQIRGFTETLNNIGLVSGNRTINWSDAHFQTLETADSVALTLDDWSASGFYAKLRLEVNVTNTAHTLTLPPQVPTDNADNIQGCTSRVITFPTVGKYLFEFSTYDSGTTIYVEDVLRNYIIATGASLGVDAFRAVSVESGLSTVVYAVTVAGPQGGDTGNKYRLNGVYRLAPNLVVGYTYVFDQDDATNVYFPNANGTNVNPHPVNFSADNLSGLLGGGTSYLDNVQYFLDGIAVLQTVYNGAAFNTATARRVHITVTNDTPALLYYWCYNHQAMGNSIVTADPGGTSTFTTITVSTAADIISNTASTSTTTGALKVVGGAGIVGDVFIGGNVTTDGRFVGDVTGTVTGSVTGSAATAATVTEAVQANITSVGILTSLTSNGSIVTTSTTGGVGYATGAGGTVTQGSDSGKATTVTLNKTTGTITLDAASLAANASVAASFTLTNSTIADTDLVLIQHQSVGTLGGYTFAATPSAGSAQIFVRNVTQTALAEAIVLRFAVIKSVNS